MAGMVEGRWVDSLPAAEEIQSGRFVRKDSAFRSIISSGKVGNFPAVAGRYHLWVSYGCPWAARALAFRALKGLEEMIPVHYARIGLGNEGWTFDAGPDGAASSAGFPLHRLYSGAVPDYTGKVTVPVLWDSETGGIVNNESAEIIRILGSAFEWYYGKLSGSVSRAFTRRDRPME